ncbi:MAG: ArsA family ATPase [Dehalococcoidia bacterium]
MRIILYTGKGGVGKTSVAAATALRSAELGYKTIVFSTDAAHSLGDAFDMTLSEEPVTVVDNLWAQEIDVLKELDVHWDTVRNWLTALMRWQGVDEVVADELAVLPGMNELVGLLYICRYHDGGQYDVLIVDCAPTGETLRLLSFPETARWYMQRIFPLERRAFSVLNPLLKPILKMPLPDEKVFDSVQFLFKQIERMRDILTNPQISSVRLVVNPEKMVIKESQRTFTYINLYGYFTDVVTCNRLIPEEVNDPYFSYWKENQKEYYKLIEECFSPLPILRVPLMDREVVGLEMLRAMAQALYGDGDPTKHYFQGRPQEIEHVDGSYILKMFLPLVSKEEISVTQNGDELVIQAGHYRRNVLLPHALTGLPVIEAKLEGNELKLKFEESKPSPSERR